LSWAIWQVGRFNISVVAVEFICVNLITSEEMFRWFARVFTMEK